MAEEKGGVFPLVDRKTPVADRIRTRVTQNNLGEALGKRVGEFLNSEDEVSKGKVANELAKDFREALADEIDVEPHQISDDVVNRMKDMFTQPDASEVLTEEAQRQLGVTDSPQAKDPEGSEQAEEDEEGGDEFSYSS